MKPHVPRTCRGACFHKGHARFLSSPSGTPNPPPRRVDLEQIASLHPGLPDVAQFFHRASNTHRPVDAQCTGLATRYAERRNLASVGQHAGRHRFQETLTRPDQLTPLLALQPSLLTTKANRP